MPFYFVILFEVLLGFYIITLYHFMAIITRTIALLHNKLSQANS